MLGDAIDYPRRGADWLRNVGIGGVLMLVSFIPLLPQLLLWGYYKRVLAQPEGEPDRIEPPAFDEWEDLLVDGVKAWLVSLVYGVVPGMLLGVVAAFGALVLGLGGVALVGDGGGGGSGAETAGFALASLVFVLVLLALVSVVLVVVGYLMPAAVALYAREEEFGAAFDFSALRGVVLSGEYFVAWLLAALVLVVGSVVGGLLVVVFFLGVFVIFYATVVAVRLIGVGVDRALAEQGGEPSPE